MRGGDVDSVFRQTGFPDNIAKRIACEVVLEGSSCGSNLFDNLLDQYLDRSSPSISPTPIIWIRLPVVLVHSF
jgi:hypothetical protein